MSQLIFHDWKTASAEESKKLKILLWNYHHPKEAAAGEVPYLKIDYDTLHSYTIYILSDDKKSVLAYGSCCVYGTGDHPKYMRRSGQRYFRDNCMRGLWITHLYSHLPGAGSMILPELEKLLLKHVDEVPRKNIYISALDEANSFYRMKGGYVTITTSNKTFKESDSEELKKIWEEEGTHCVWEWEENGNTWLAKPCSGTVLDQETPYVYDVLNKYFVLPFMFRKQEFDLLKQYINFPPSYSQEEWDKLFARIKENRPYRTETSEEYRKKHGVILGKISDRFLWCYLVSHFKFDKEPQFVSVDCSIFTESFLKHFTPESLREYATDLAEYMDD